MPQVHFTHSSAFVELQSKQYRCRSVICIRSGKRGSCCHSRSCSTASLCELTSPPALHCALGCGRLSEFSLLAIWDIVREIMDQNRAIRVGVFPHGNQMTECAPYLRKLQPTEECTDIGMAADILGNALEIAQIPYKVVPLKFDGQYGKFDEKLDTWTGLTSDSSKYCAMMRWYHRKSMSAGRFVQGY